MENKSSLAYSFRSALKAHVTGGNLLLIVTVIALFVANSSMGDAYRDLWNLPVHLQIGSFNVFSHAGEPMTLMAFINDALMAIFFFTVGLEIKREVKVGELSSVKMALLPIIAAVGGMVIPVLIYWGITHGTPAEAGMATPMATDIAFSLGVLSLFGKRVPISLKVFLTAFAVVDDIGGILVIALFYTQHIAVDYLLAAAVVLVVMFTANKREVRNKTFYLMCAVVMWYLFLQSGIHSTIAGVISAFMVPATPSIHIGKYITRIETHIRQFADLKCENVILQNTQIDELKSIESASDNVVSPLQRLEDNLHGFVNYFIMPVFAFANAGILLTGPEGVTVGTASYAAAIGLLLGKFVGIYSFTFFSIKSGMASRPQGMTWTNLSGIALLGGIGFTMSLFIANLSFQTDVVLLNQVKLGVLLGTLLTGVLGCIVLYYTLPKEE